MADYFIGEIRPFAFSFPPVDFMWCNGQTMSISQYPALYALVGTKFGGDGTTTFKLPNIQGQVIVGSGTMAPTNTVYPWGQTGGVTTVTLTQSQIPTHDHTFNGISAGLSGASILAEANAPAANGTSALSNFVAKTSAGVNVANTFGYAHTDTSAAELAAGSIVPFGTGGAHNNMGPYVTINYCICVQNGEWPSRN